MYRCKAGDQPLDDTLDADLPLEEFERLERVEALLRLVAAHDGDDRIARSIGDWLQGGPGFVRRRP